MWFITDDVYPACIHLHFWCACNKSQGDQRQDGWGVWSQYLLCTWSKYRSSVSGTPIPILSDTHSHSLLLLLLLNRDLGWGPWSFIPAKLDPGEGLVGTDVRLQEALEAPGVSMTLASMLFGKVNGRLRQMRKQQKDNALNGKETSGLWQTFKSEASLAWKSQHQ